MIKITSMPVKKVLQRQPGASLLLVPWLFQLAGKLQHQPFSGYAQWQWVTVAFGCCGVPQAGAQPCWGVSTTGQHVNLPSFQRWSVKQAKAQLENCRHAAGQSLLKLLLWIITSFCSHEKLNFWCPVVLSFYMLELPHATSSSGVTINQ